MTADSFRLRVDTGLELHISQWGSSNHQALLILHGGGHDATCWASVCEHLADRFRCVVPDARGHGQSDWAADGDYSCPSQVADYLSVVDQLGLQGCALAGHSMGGLNALQLGGSYPSRFRGLVLVDVGTETRDSGLKHVQHKRENSPPPDLKQRYGVQPAAADPRMRDHVATYCGDAAHRRALLQSATGPVLVIRGEHSAILTPDSARMTADLVHGQVVDIPGSGHNVSLANPLATAAALGTFLGALESH